MGKDTLGNGGRGSIDSSASTVSILVFFMLIVVGHDNYADTASAYRLDATLAMLSPGPCSVP